MMTFETIINQVAEFYGIENDDLLGGCRREIFCDARHVAMYLCRRLLGMRKDVIGASFGKSRYIVDYASRKVSEYLAEPRYNRRAAECVITILNNEKK